MFTRRYHLIILLAAAVLLLAACNLPRQAPASTSDPHLA